MRLSCKIRGYGVPFWERAIPHPPCFCPTVCKHLKAKWLQNPYAPKSEQKHEKYRVSVISAKFRAAIGPLCIRLTKAQRTRVNRERSDQAHTSILHPK